MTDLSMPPGCDHPHRGEPAPRRAAEIATLRDLHARLGDIRAGCTTVVENSDPRFTGIAWEMRGLHQRQAGRVLSMLRDLGAAAQAAASADARGTPAVIEQWCRFDDAGSDAMNALVIGERRLLRDFKAAVAASASVERRGMLDQMCREILMLLLCAEIFMRLQRRAPEPPAGSCDPRGPDEAPARPRLR